MTEQEFDKIRMDRHIINESSTLIEALRRLNDLSGMSMTLFVTDHTGRLKGTLTDGDVRRALVGGASLESKVYDVMHHDFRSLHGKIIDVAAIKDYRNHGIMLLPWIDDEGKIKKIIDLSHNHTVLPLSAILMAGGKGERLRPMTLDTPKPLLKIGEKAIIDYNIEALVRCGISDITVTTRYLSEKIVEHFKEPVAGVKVKCVKEERTSGTIGSASLATVLKDGNTIVMNSDLLTTVSFEDMYIHHISHEADITIAAIPYQVSVPFAILSSDGNSPDRVTGLEEKPSYSYFANAGIYIFSNKLLRMIPKEGHTDATEVIEQAIADGLTVTQFPLNGTWIDIGSPSDFRQANELIKYVKTI